MRPYYDRGGVTLFCGDNRAVIPALSKAGMEFDAVITDPPYGISFMSRAWDHEVPGPAYWKAMSTVMKPGAHLLSFGGTRAFYRMAVAIEDSGFEIRDTIMWLFGEGFPKGQDIGKLIDKAAGVDREIIGPGPYAGRRPNHSGGGANGDVAYGDLNGDDVSTAPSAEAAKQWSGWNTQLKPAYEPIVVARKPVEGSVHENVLQHGTGAINVDACRIGTGNDRSSGGPSGKQDSSVYKAGLGIDFPRPEGGRYPANIILDEAAGDILDEQSGVSKPSAHRRIPSGSERVGQSHGGFKNTNDIHSNLSDTGGASRFFYCAKASRKERGELNLHPTVKPIELMRYLIRMTVPKGAVILDPFAGSGTTLIAAALEGVQAVGIEQSPEYCAIIKHRLKLYMEEIRGERR